MRELLGLLVLCCAGCGLVSYDSIAASATDASEAVADADLSAPFGAPEVVAAVASDQLEDDPSLDGQQTELYFSQNNNIWVASGQDFSTRMQAAGLAEPGVDEDSPELSRDGLTMFYTVGNVGMELADISIATRSSLGDPWLPGPQPAELNSDRNERSPAPSADLLTIVFASNRGATNRIYIAERASTSAPWSTPRELTELAATGTEDSPMLSDDKLSLYFTSDRSGNFDLYVARRASVDDPFGSPEPLTEINTDAEESDPWISPDQRTLYFTTDRGGNRDVYVSRR